MKKLIKLLTLGINMMLIAACLSGCLASVSETSVNADGSGTIKMSVGMTKDALAQFEAMGTETFEGQETSTFNYNGTEYEGVVETVSFKNVEEFNQLMNTDNEEESEVPMESGLFSLAKNPDGSLTLVFEATSETGNTDDLEGSIKLQGDIDEDGIQAMLNEMAIVFEFHFASDIIQTSGPKDGITINGKNLKINLIKLGVTENTTYTFKTSLLNEPSNEAPQTPSELITPATPSNTTFTDVPVDFWGFNAIESMAKSGIILGVGDGKFAPNDSLTYGQFCQILAKSEGLPTGESNGHWAGKAVESVIEQYHIDNLTREKIDYDAPITREVAIAAMFRSKAADVTVPYDKISEKDIPDYDSISLECQWDVLDAYRIGITNGIDSKRTFAPKAYLTRAEICQLFYNAGLQFEK